MFDDVFGEFGTAFNDFIESDFVQIGLRVLVIYLVLIWLGSAFWAYRDMRLRTASPFAPYVAAATIIVFTPVFFLFGLLLYRIVRPKETIAEVNERALAEEAMLAEVQSRPHCANCSRPVHDEWIICPTCRNRLRRVCPNCEHLIELDWTLCAWCGKDFERVESPGTAYMPSARRGQGQQPAPVPQRPPPPPPPRVVGPRPAPPTPAPAPSQSTGGPSEGGSSREGGAGRDTGGGRTSTPEPPTQPQPRSLGSAQAQAQPASGEG